MLAFVTHPTILQTAHAELDAVVGFDRTPRFEDEPHLPYIRALVKEVLRWRPVAVLGGTPHASSEDDIYQGWRIPTGTTILGNSWAINLNEEYYPDPHLFNPARFLDPDDPRYVPELRGRKTHPAKAGHSSFGWGRRICPGADLAANSLFIALSKLIWSFDILPTRTYDTFDYTNGFNIRPQPFQCLIRVRSDVHRRVLEREMIDAEIEMEKFPAYE
jgi:cytochrome P450